MTTSTIQGTDPRELKQLYNPPAAKAVAVDVPEIDFLMIGGRGDPNTSQEYRDAIQALYGFSYTLKFTLKKADGIDYKVSPLEGLWWSDNMSDFLNSNKANWQWTMMIGQPPYITANLVAEVLEKLAREKDLPALPKIRYEMFEEGLCAQIMHIGPYAAEAPTIERLHAFIKESGCVPRGKHHEIYIGDPNRAASEKLKTIVRQPMEPSPVIY